MSDNMSDSEDFDNFQYNDFKDVNEEINQLKRNPQTSGMFVSGWDDADQDVDIVKNPKGKLLILLNLIIFKSS